MRIEFYVIAGLVLLALVNIFWAGAAKTRQYGTEWNMGARDGKMPELQPVPARLARAQANLFETLPLFLATLLAALLAGHAGWKTQWGSCIYLAARVIYLPLYAAGVPVVRTVVFMISLLGLLLTLWALAFG
ncbi:MAPEG family protein [Asaia bogorensis]|uniref:MAPEG family protein n=1 Tax=Asaia bogorensis TaxID=91915 RepID=UPI0028623F2E|nr:MAPEG family protein [Asaia bogorensis]MDR6182976.1 putative MAPEG superfamily protein [Asaia bogorensis NBRC 16594]